MTVKITIKKHPEVKLKRPLFHCDTELKEKVPKPYHYLVQGFKFCLVVGRAGSGKTSLLFSLFKDKRILRKTFNNIILVMPTHSLNSMSSSSNIFKDLSPEKFYNDIEEIETIKEQIKYYANENESTALIIDDMASKLKNPDITRALNELVMNRRHYRCSSFLLTQVYERCPLVLRKQISDLIILYKPSKKELVSVYEEQLEQKENVVAEVFKVAFTKPYDFMFIDVPSQSIYHNYDELILEKE